MSSETLPLNPQKATEISTEATPQEQPQNRVLYTADVYSLFIHPLIAYPDRAFNTPNNSYMYDWFVTVDEFHRIIKELYINNFILVRTDDLYSWNDTLHKPEKKELFLPEGKKPLLFSIDDLNYYQSMISGGTNNCLAFSRSGQLVVQGQNETGVLEFTRNEAIFIIDDFVAAHPDFSLNGAKGTIALTGYNGAFGYDIRNTQDPDFETVFTTVQVIAETLKKSGWEFASHGYAHLHTDRASEQKFVQDCILWQNIVEPVIGKTHVYILPFGEEPSVHPEHWQTLQNFDFRIIFGVGAGTTAHWKNSYLFIRRRAIDGIFCDSAQTKINPFFAKENVFRQQPRKR